MRLDVRAFGLAAGTVAAILYVVCAVAIVLAPGPTSTLASYLIHMDISTMPRVVTPGGFLVGLVVWTVGMTAVHAAAAGIYNRLAVGSHEKRVQVGRPATA